MGMLLYMEELKRKEAEQAAKEPEKPVKPVEEPKAVDSTVTEKEAVKKAKKPVKRVAGRRTSK